MKRSPDMRGLTAAEQRAERLQAMTYLGLLADDVALATFHYPSVSEKEAGALKQFDEMLQSVGMPRTENMAFPRRKSMSDPTSILSHAAQIVTTASQPTPDLVSLREPLAELLNGEADEKALLLVRSFAEVLGRITLTCTEEIANEKGVEDWIPQTSSYSAA
jgi:hypothetical protein